MVQSLFQAVPASAVLHTDDLAWHLTCCARRCWNRCGWASPWTSGPGLGNAWEMRGGPGSISVPAGLEMGWVEGNGTSRRSLSALLDVSNWVHSDKAEAERRPVAREGPGEELLRQEREEIPFLLDDQAWRRATVIVAGTPVLSEILPGHVAACTGPRLTPA
jgi:hypothetical protein